MKNRSKLGMSVVVALAATTLALTACAGGSAPEPSANDAPKVEVIRWLQPNATPHLNSSVAIYAVGKQYGFFEREGVYPDLAYTQSNVSLIQALASGRAEIASSGLEAILSAVDEGIPIVTVSSFVNTVTWRIAVPKGSPIKDASDLVGKKIGVLSLGSGSSSFAGAFMEANGESKDSMDMVAVGATIAAANALASGEVAALALYTTVYGELEVLGQSFDFLPNPPSMDGLFGTSWIATKSAMADKSDLLARFMRASYEALMFSKANPEAAMRAGYVEYPELLGAGRTIEEALPNDVKVLKIWIDSVTPSGPPEEWTNLGDIPVKNWAKMVQYMADTSDTDVTSLDINEYWDPALVGRINAEFPTGEILKLAASAG